VKEHIEGGFVLLARQIINSSLMAMKGNDVKLAICFLGKANWQDRKWHDRWQHKEIIIKRGELIGTLRTWAKEAKMTLKETRNALRRLLEHGFIQHITPNTVKRAQGYTHLRIRKYEKYQDLTNYRVAKRAQGGHRVGTEWAQSGHRLNKDEERKEGEGGNTPPSFSKSSQREKADAITVFWLAWQQLHCKTWETPEEYLPTGFEQRAVREAITPITVERYVAYAYYYHQKDVKVGVIPGQQLPVVDKFFKAVAYYCTSLRNGSVEWERAKSWSREFLSQHRGLNPRLFQTG
jgi:DNA-binding Lrp family transcriptional regulator